MIVKQIGVKMKLTALFLLGSFIAGSMACAAPSDTIVLTRDNTVTLQDEVNGESVARIISKVKELDNDPFHLGEMGLKKNPPIYLFLYTPGGSIQSGLELLEFLHGTHRPVNTVTMFAASMGFQIVQDLGTRYVLNKGVMMSHRAAGQFQGSFGGKPPSQLDSRYHFWLERLTEMDEQTVKRTNGKQTLKSYQEAYADELWLTGSKSVSGGYSDKVIKVRCDESLAGVTTHSANIQGLINIEYSLDNCPMNTNPMNVKASFPTTKGIMHLEEFLTQGGQFGTACLQQAGVKPGQLCALDSSLSISRIEDLIAQFKDRFYNIRDHVVPMYW